MLVFFNMFGIEDNDNYYHAQFDSARVNLQKAKQNGDFDLAIHFCDVLDSIAEISKDQDLILNGKINRLYLYRGFGEDDLALDVALSTYNNTFHNVEVISNCGGYLSIVGYLVDFMEVIHNYDQAITYLYEYKNSNCNEIENFGEFNRVDYKIATFLVEIDQPDSALSVILSHLEEVKESKNNFAIIGTYNEVGMIAKSIGDYDLAIEFFNVAIARIDSLDIKRNLKPVILGNIGDCNYLLGDYIKAYEFLEYDSQGSIEFKEYNSHYTAEVGLARLDAINLNYTKAIGRITKLLSNDKIRFSLEMKGFCYLTLSQNHEKLNQPRKALDYANKYSIVNDSLVKLKQLEYEKFMAKNSEIIYNQVKTQLDQTNELAANEMQLLNNKLKIKEGNNRLLVSFFVLVLLIVSFVVWRNKVFRKKDLVIEQQKLKIAEQNLRIENENRQKLELQLDAKNKKTRTLVVELESKQNAVVKILDKLKEISDISNQDLKGLEIFIQNELELKSTRIEIEDYINNIGDNFFFNLKNTHVNLTENDILLCAMVVLKMSNKEIGISKSSTPESIKTAKNRLKKKLELGQNNNLCEYLTNLI